MLLKTSTFFFLFTFFTIGSYAQETWTTLIGKTFHQSERFTDGILSPDGDIIAVGIQRKPDGFNAIYLVKMDISTGDEIWSKTYEINQNEEAYTIAPTADGFLIGGNTVSEDNRYGDALVVKFDWEGNQQWEVIQGKTYRDQINDIVVKSDGTIYAGGYKVEQLEDKTEHYLLKISADGSTVEEIENGISSSAGQAYDLLFLGPNEKIFFPGIGGSNAMYELNESQPAVKVFTATLEFDEFRHVFFLDDRIFVLSEAGFRDIQVVEYDSEGSIVQQSAVIDAEPGAGFIDSWQWLKVTVSNSLINIALVTGTQQQSLQRISLSTATLAVQSDISQDFPNTFDAWNNLPLPTGFLVFDYAQPSNQWDAHAVRYADDGTSLWDKKFGINEGPDYSAGGGIVAANSGGYLIQYVESSEDNTDLFIAQMNEDGELQWQTQIPDERAQAPLSMLSQASDGSIYTFLYTGEIPLIAKLSEAGVLLWTKEMTVEHGNAFKTGLIAMPDNGVAAVFRYFDDDAGINTTRFVRLNDVGDIMEDKPITLDYGYLDIRALALTGDNHIAMAGNARFQSGDPSFPYLAKTDLNGNIVWDQIVAPVDIENFGRFYDVSTTADNNILLSGWGFHAFTGGIAPIIASFDLAGNSIYEKLINADNQYGGAGYANIADDQNNHFHLGYKDLAFNDAGYSALTSLEGWMLKTDAQGTILWEKTFGLGRRPIIYDAAASPEGGFVGIGISAINGSFTTFITKVAEDGTTKTNTPVAPAFKYNLAPNPTNDFVNIQFMETSLEDLSITIYDMQGKLLMQDNWPAGQLQKSYPVDQFPNGIYNVVMKGATFQSTQLLVKQ